MKASLILAVVLSATALGFSAPIEQSATAQGLPLAIIVAPGTRERDISLALVRRIFKGNTTEFAGKRMTPFCYPYANSLRSGFDRAVLGFTPEQVGAYWVDRRIRGQGLAPRSVPEAAVMKAVVAKVPGAIGYIPANEVDASVQALTVDGKAHNTPGYPIL
jgi:hypothetical protein